MAKRGVIVGKFYPPHRGHRFLIETAEAQVDHLTVIVCGKPAQTVPASLRACWLREIHPNVEILEVADTLSDDDSEGWASYTRELLGCTPDVVFTSEDYGEPFAHYLGCRHVLVDRERTRISCSGTAIRACPLEHWGFLEPCVRAYFVKRVAIIGAESSGSTTLAQALAAHYKTVWVPEYGREYAEIKMRGPDALVWRSEEFIRIAVQQCAMEDAAARQADRVLVCDTPAFATSLWHERYLGRLSPDVENLAASHQYDLYFLTDVDIPFVQDGTRDGEHIRLGMHTRFVEWLNTHGRPFTLLSGSPDRRLHTATTLIDRLLEEG